MGTRRYSIFAVVACALLMASIDQTIVATALPALQHDLNARVNWSTWTITIYALGQVLVMPLAGRLGDQYGRKRIFLTAVTLFTTASLCCGLAGNIYVLVLLRAVQAVGGGAFMPTATGIVTDQFGPDRDRAVGLFASIFPIGGVIGPILGGFFVADLSWRWIFFVNVPVGIAVFFLALAFIPARQNLRTQSFDLAGVGLLGITLLPAMLGLTYLGNGTGTPLSPGFLLPVLVALVGGTLFIRHAGAAETPFIPLRLLHGGGFGVMHALNFLFGSALLGFGALVPLYAEERYGIGEIPAGTLLTARAIGMVAAAGSAVYLLRRTGYRRPMFLGFTVVAAGLALLAMHPADVSPYTWLAVSAGITGLGMGVSTPASNNATLDLAPDETASVAGLRGMFRQAGGITAVSLTAALLARSTDPGATQAHLFLGLGVILLAALPLILLVPEHRGAW